LGAARWWRRPLTVVSRPHCLVASTHKQASQAGGVAGRDQARSPAGGGGGVPPRAGQNRLRHRWTRRKILIFLATSPNRRSPDR
jgi:hypothetical protein